MVCCVAVGCAVRPGMGRIMHRFPRNPQRRRQWENNVQRQNWRAHNLSFLCSDHFDESQYESGRADGLKRLKQTAVPTKFVFTKSGRMPWRPSKKRQIICTEPTDLPAKLILTEHSYTILRADDDQQELQTLPGEDGKNHINITPDTDGNRVTENNDAGNTTLDAAGGCSSAENKVAGTENPTHDTEGSKSAEESAAERITIKQEDITSTVDTVVAANPVSELREAELLREIKYLREKVVKERKEKYKALKEKNALERNIAKVFSTDQIARLSRGIHGGNSRGMRWSNETIKKGLLLKFACGSTGYSLLLQQNLPLPSLRSLRRRIVKMDSGTLGEVFSLLQMKDVTMQEEEKECCLILDEMCIEASQQCDRSTSSSCLKADVIVKQHSGT